MVDLPEWTMMRPFLSLRDKAHQHGYPDPMDPGLIGMLVEQQNGVQRYKQERFQNVLDFNSGRVYMVEGFGGSFVFDQLVGFNEGSEVRPGLDHFGLDPAEVVDQKERQREMKKLLLRAVDAGHSIYTEQFEGFLRGRGLPPDWQTIESVRKDVRRFEDEYTSTGSFIGESSSWWWEMEGDEVRYRRGRLSEKRLERDTIHGPFRSYTAAEEDALRSQSRPKHYEIGLFA